MAELLLAENPRRDSRGRFLKRGRGRRRHNPSFLMDNPVSFMEMENPRRRRRRSRRNPRGLSLRGFAGGRLEDLAVDALALVGSVAATLMIGKQASTSLTASMQGEGKEWADIGLYGVTGLALGKGAEMVGVSTRIENIVRLGGLSVAAAKAVHKALPSLATSWGIPRYNGVSVLPAPVGTRLLPNLANVPTVKNKAFSPGYQL